MSIIPFDDHSPSIDPTVFVAPNAFVIGKTTICEHSTILFGAVLRGDVQSIRVGARSNIQDNAILHTTWDQTDCVVGDDVTVGHNAILHGCTVSDRCIIGMHSTLLDGAIIEPECIVGANTLVPSNMVVPTRSLVIGTPAKVIRPLKTVEIDFLVESARRYQNTGAKYKHYFENTVKQSS